MSQSPSRSRSTDSGGSASANSTRRPGCLRVTLAMAAGTSVELPLGNAMTRTRPARSPAIAATSSSAEASALRIVAAWRFSTSPASVSRIRRPTRTTSGVPAARSRARICWLIAGWVYPSSRAAAEYEPVRATSRRTRRWRESNTGQL